MIKKERMYCTVAYVPNTVWHTLHVLCRPQQEDRRTSIRGHYNRYYIISIQTVHWGSPSCIGYMLWQQYGLSYIAIYSLFKI